MTTAKVAIVTGGTAGIVFSTAMMLVKGGAVVSICGRRQKKGAEALEKLHQMCLYSRDVSKTSDCSRIIQDTISRLGRLDILVNTAGIYVGGPIDSVQEEVYYWVMDINVKGALMALPALRKSGGGAIVNVLS